MLQVSLWALMLAVLFTLKLPAAHAAQEEPLRAQLTAMGGIPINISAWGLEQEDFDVAVRAINQRFQRLEHMMSTYIEDSEISRINRGEDVVPLPSDLLNVLEAALRFSESTDGAFDITVQPLIKLWRDSARAQQLPDATARKAALQLVGYRHVHLERQLSHVRLDQAGVQLDLGGIAQGYFADEAVQLLRKAGAQRCLVDVSGDITCWQADDRQSFSIGIKDPTSPQQLLAIVKMSNGAVTTSGNYERFYEINGQRYCHIFDPRTGEPVEGMLSVTLFAPTGMEADALATAVFVMGAVRGRAFVESHPGLEAVIIYSSMRLENNSQLGQISTYVSPELRERIQLLQLH